MVKRCGFLALRFQCLVDILSFLLKLKVLKEYGSETTGIFVMSMTDYINGFWPDLNEAKDLLESLSSINDVEELNIGRSDIAVLVQRLNSFSCWTSLLSDKGYHQGVTSL